MGSTENEDALAGKLGKRLAELRKNAEMTQARLAAAVGVEPETISRIERGTVAPSIARLAELSSALNVQLHEVLMLDIVASDRDRAMARLTGLLHDWPPKEIDGVSEIVKQIRDTWK